jgi:hypothetical protein
MIVLVLANLVASDGLGLIAASKPPNPFWILVGGVALLTLIVSLIRRGSRKQRPVLWVAFALIVLVILFPPWQGEKCTWVDPAQDTGRHDPQYVCSDVSMGYSFVFLAPRRTSAVTSAHIHINYIRLLIQIGIVILLAGPPVYVFRRRRPGSRQRAAGETPVA